MAAFSQGLKEACFIERQNVAGDNGSASHVAVANRVQPLFSRRRRRSDRGASDIARARQRGDRIKLQIAAVHESPLFTDIAAQPPDVYLEGCCPALLALKRVRVHIIGAVDFKRLAHTVT